MSTLISVVGLNIEHQLAKPNDFSHTYITGGKISNVIQFSLVLWKKSVGALCINVLLEKSHKPEYFSSLFCTSTSPVLDLHQIVLLSF